MNELIQLIKKTHIPIITMCNDRQSQKVRSLANYTYDLRFYRPRVDQIKGAIMSICFKEGLKIQPPTLNNIIAMANQDVRQIIHNLSMWTVDNKVLSFERAESDAAKAKKDLKIGPFEAIRKVFESTEETRKMSLIDKSDLFFHDYSLSPLFVQENYPQVMPQAARGNRTRHMKCLSRAANAISCGDLVDRKIRSSQMWSLLPTQAFYASVIPGEVMRGNWTGQPAFPSWLGKHSKTGKGMRQLSDLKGHMRLQVSGSTRDLMMDYMTPLTGTLTRPMAQREAEGVPDVIRVLNAYDLLKEDMDSILELNAWPGRQDPMAGVSSKVHVEDF
jgi:replication factor C subunit 1